MANFIRVIYKRFRLRVETESRARMEPFRNKLHYIFCIFMRVQIRNLTYEFLRTSVIHSLYIKKEFAKEIIIIPAYISPTASTGLLSERSEGLGYKKGEVPQTYGAIQRSM